MNTIIVGCGRVGSTLALELSEAGHDVAIIDRDSNAFRRLGDSFKGRTITGIGFDRDVLKSAGIGPDSAVVSVTSGDNSNILVARVARELFRVERVVARIYDPRRAAVYERLGIATVATVAWTRNRILRTIFPHDHVADWTDPTGTYQLVERRVGADLAGRKAADAGVHVALIVRNGKAEIPAADAVLQEGDIIHLVATNEGISRFDSGADGSQGGHQ